MWGFCGTRLCIVLHSTQRANISDKELNALKLLAIQLPGYTHPALAKAIKAGELIEVTKDG